MSTNWALAATDGTPAEVAVALNKALGRGDEAAVHAVMAEDVLIYESGGVERSWAEYSKHHLAADIEYMSALERTVLSRKVYAFADGSVVATRSRLTGSYKGRTVDGVSTETLVLRLQEDGWKIVHIHWSSR
jgi:ketosteroid isomerase-like protein